MRSTIKVGLRISPAICVLLSCGHIPITPERQTAYFTCEGATLQDAEKRVATAGFPILTVSETSLTTGSVQIELAPTESVKIPDRNLTKMVSEEYEAAFVAVKATGGVSFSLFMGGRKIDPITEDQLDHPVTRRELNQLRNKICGGADFF